MWHNGFNQFRNFDCSYWALGRNKFMSRNSLYSKVLAVHFIWLKGDQGFLQQYSGDAPPHLQSRGPVLRSADSITPVWHNIHAVCKPSSGNYTDDRMRCIRICVIQLWLQQLSCYLHLLFCGTEFHCISVIATKKKKTSPALFQVSCRSRHIWWNYNKAFVQPQNPVFIP